MSPQNPDTGTASEPAAIAGSRSEADSAIAFGKYRLFPGQRRLFAGERSIKLKPRAFDVLLVLAEARGALVPREQLRKRVWPNTFVDAHNLDIQIAAVRKALGPDRDLIQTDPGRGWRFVTPIRAISDATSSMTNLPAQVAPLVGRERELAELAALIASRRFVTLTGAGGIGKTRLALEAASAALPNFPDGAWLVELGPLVDAEHVCSAVGRALGIEPGANRNSVDQLIAVLQRRHLLLMLDNCEHVIETVAVTAEALLHGAPRLHILSTSQELLAADGEHIYHVSPLRAPQNRIDGAAEAVGYGAVQLFVERARAADSRFTLDDRNAAAVSRICRRLDGIPLAIELAAARVSTIGVDELANRIDDRFRLLNLGRRTAMRRHQTLGAALDWSYGLLEPAERTALNRLAIFAGSFTLDGATAVIAGSEIEPAHAGDYVVRLVRKSLVTPDTRMPVPRYRMLDSTRAYASAKLGESGEFDIVAKRLADYYRTLMERAEASWQSTPAPELVARYASEIDNIRAALNWASEPTVDPQTEIGLAAAVVPLWTLLSILGECQDLVERALTRLGTGSDEQLRQEMLLQAALAHSLIWAEGSIKAISTAFARALELAEQLGDIDYQLRTLYLQWVYRYRIGEYRTCLTVAKRFRKIAERSGDLAAIITGQRIEGTSLHYLGGHAQARTLLEQTRRHTEPDLRRSFVAYFGLDQRVSALTHLARIAWVQGFADQALSLANDSVEEARHLDHANTLCAALCSACATAALVGDLAATESFAAALIDHAERHGLGMWMIDGRALKGWVAVARGDTAKAMQLLRDTHDNCRGTRVELRHTVFVDALSEVLATVGRAAEGLAVVQEAIDESSRNEGLWRLPELLRLRGEMTLRGDDPAAPFAAEKNFREALALSAKQGARSWELRAAMSLARLCHRLGQAPKALDVLGPIFDGFTEGFETADLKAAKALIESLRATR